jgi:cytosine/adenosine deaminase-related metal-dependent hydrolase
LQTFTASWVVPVDRPPLRNGRVTTSEGRVLWVGSAGDPGEPDGPLHDLGPGVLLPGLVNAHCHLELSYLALALRGAGGFVPWVEGLVAKRDDPGSPEPREAVRRAIVELEATGTVAVADVSNGLAHLDLLEASSLSAVVFYELLGWDPERAAGLLEEADRRAATVPWRLRTRVRLSAHAPHSVSPALLAGLVARGGPAAIHLAESSEESRFLAQGDGDWGAFLARRGLGHVAFSPPGTTPVRYLEDAGALRTGLLAAHCVHVDEGDRELLARRRVYVAVCPRSNRALGVGIPPVPDLLRAGVRLCLGTDSLASVPSLDLGADMAALQREFPALDPVVIVRMATQGGAEALGLRDLGTLTPGKQAALAFAPARRPPHDPWAFLVSGEVPFERVRA